MTVNVVSPITIPVGGTAHITPIDQNNMPIPIAQCTLGVSLPAPLATWVKDVTGFVLTAVATGSYAGVKVQWSDGVNPSVQSIAFTVTVLPPPPAVTAVGTTSP